MHNRKWSEGAIAKLQAGEIVQVRPKGHSMQGKINDGDLVTLASCLSQDLKAGDIVLARVLGHRYHHLVLHLILECETEKFLIGSNRDRIDGWVSAENIFGKVVEIEHLEPNADTIK